MNGKPLMPRPPSLSFREQNQLAQRREDAEARGNSLRPGDSAPLRFVSVTCRITGERETSALNPALLETARRSLRLSPDYRDEGAFRLRVAKKTGNYWPHTGPPGTGARG